MDDMGYSSGVECQLISIRCGFKNEYDSFPYQIQRKLTYSNIYDCESLYAKRFFLYFCLSVLKCDWRFEMRVVANAQSLWGLDLSSHIHKSSNNTGAMSPRS